MGAPAPDVRVLQVVLSLNPGGTERLVLDLIERLHPTIPMMVCCLDEPGLWAPELDGIGVEVHALDRQPGFHPSLGKAIAELGRRHRATLIHAHHYSPFVYSCISKVWRSDVSVVFTEHGRVSDAPPSSKRRLANGVLSRLPSRVFSVSANLREHMIGEGFPAARVEVIPNGIAIRPPVDAEERAKVRAALGVAPSEFVVGTIARLNPVKDLVTLVGAVAALAADVPVTAVVIGDGPERDALGTAAAARGVGSRVRFLGHRDDARDWLAGFDAFVNSSISEGVSLTILEAMSAGLPVVATAVGGTPEVVVAECGRLVPARDPGAIAAALRELAADADLRRRLGEAGRARVESTFSLDRMIATYRDVYLGAA